MGASLRAEIRDAIRHPVGEFPLLNIINLLKQTSAYMVAHGFYGLSSFAVIPIAVNGMSQSDYGKLAIWIAVALLIESVVAFNSVSFPFVSFGEKKYNLTEAISSFHSAAMLSLVPIFALGFPINAFAGYFSNFEFSLIVIYALFLILFTLRMSMAQIRGRVKLYLSVYVILAILNVFLTEVFVSSQEMGFLGRLYAMFGSYAVALLTVYFLDEPTVFGHIFPRKLQSLLDNLRFGLSFLAYKIIKQLRGQGDKFIVAAFLGQDSVAIIALAFSLAVPFSLFQQATEKVVTPKLLSTLTKLIDSGSPFSLKLIWHEVGSLVLVTGLCMIPLAFLIQLVMTAYTTAFLPEVYVTATQILPFILGAMFIQALTSQIVTIYSKLRLAKILTSLSLIQLFLQFFVSIFLTWIFGLIGAAIAYLVVSVVALLVYFSAIKVKLERNV